MCWYYLGNHTKTAGEDIEEKKSIKMAEAEKMHRIKHPGRQTVGVLVKETNNFQLFFQSMLLGVRIQGRLPELLLLRERIRSCGISSREEHRL